MRTIKIAGAGISGLAAAINLVKSGFHVEIHEKSHDSGTRFSSDMQGLENWTTEEDVLDVLKSMNIAINFDMTPFKTLHVYDFELNEFILHSERPLFYLVQRGAVEGSIDYGLKTQALDNGVVIKFNEISDGNDVDIIATGPKKPFAIAKGISFRTNHEDIAIGILNDEIAPKAYAYIMISKGKGCMATVLGAQFEDIDKYFNILMETKDKIFEKRGDKLEMSDIKTFSGFGNFHLMDNYFRASKYWVGEAAGLQDKLWGFGMRYALGSGYLAAKSIVENRDYDALLRQKYMKQLKTGVINRYFFEKLGNKGYSYFLNKAKKSPIKFLRRAYSSSFLRIMIFNVKKVFSRKKDEE